MLFVFLELRSQYNWHLFMATEMSEVCTREVKAPSQSILEDDHREVKER